MTKVRKQAMGSYLQDKKPKNAVQKRQSRAQRGASTDSKANSAASDQQETDVVNPNGPVLEVGERERKKKDGRTPSSPRLSPQERQPRKPETQVSRVRQGIGQIFPSAPMVSPSRTDVKLAYDVTAPAPFQSIGKPLDPFRTMFNPNHPRISVEELKFYCMSKSVYSLQTILIHYRLPCFWHKSNGPALDPNAGQVTSRISEYPLHRLRTF